MPWQLTKSAAIGTIGTNLLKVFPGFPERPAQVGYDSQSIDPWEVASVKPIPTHACAPQEIYSRKEDLICRYRQSESDLFAFQLDWQLLPAVGPFACGVELWLSVQTDLLDAKPELEVTCHATSSRAWQVFSHDEISDEPISNDQNIRGPAAMVSRSSGQENNPNCGVWLIEPSDQVHTRMTSDAADLTQSVRMFGHFMEKGVIRRGRMRFLLALESVSDSDVAHAYQQFANSPLPLTA